jgi:hypothetical protein
MFMAFNCLPLLTLKAFNNFYKKLAIFAHLPLNCNFIQVFTKSHKTQELQKILRS